MITQQFLIETFDYKNGHLIWKTNRTPGVKAGDIAGTIAKSGYSQIRLNGKTYKAHRLIFIYHHGYFPGFVDHIDRNKSNNKIENLREASLVQNQGNRKMDVRNTSGYRGVSWYKKDKKWGARITMNGTKKFLGLFEDPSDAYDAYCKEAKNHFGSYANV